MQGNEVVDLQKFRDADKADKAAAGTGDQFLPAGTTLLLRQYKIEGYLNCGGFGITYVARDSLNRKIVIKECFPGEMVYRDGKAMSARSTRYADEISSIVRHFVTEAHSLANLTHDNIVHVHQIFEENDTAYMAMDFIDGPDLLDLLDSNRKLSPKQVQKITRAMLDAVGYVHRMGMLHRDISPDNILVETSGKPVLIDFGAARLHVQQVQKALTRMKFVKDGYSPQEFYIAGAEQGTYSDLYALAASIYHLITGTAPADSQSRLSARAARADDPYVPLAGSVTGYPQRFLAAIDSALSVMPRDRLQTAEEWLDMIGPETSKLSVISRPASAVLESLSGFEIFKGNGQETARNRKKLLAAGAVGLALLGAAGTYLAQGPGDAGAPVASGTSPVAAPRVDLALAVPAEPATGPLVVAALPASDPARIAVAARRPAALAEATFSPPPALDIAPAAAASPELGDSGTAFAAAAAEAPDIARPGAVTALLDPETSDAPPETPSPLAPPPPLASKLDFPHFGDVAIGSGVAEPGPFDPVSPAVHVAALPPTMMDSAADADTAPPANVTSGEIRDMQISYSYWDVALPFRTEMRQEGGATVATVTSVASAADPAASGTWIEEGTQITALNGEELRADRPVSVLLLETLAIDPDGHTRATVAYRDATNGFRGRGELAVPVLRKIGLFDGTVLETRREGASWVTSVAVLGSSATGLRVGDVLMGEETTGRWFDGHRSVETTLNDLAALGTGSARFTVLRNGARESAGWRLARQ